MGDWYTETKAAEYAYDHLCDIAPLDRELPEQLKPNRIIRVSRLRAVK